MEINVGAMKKTITVLTVIFLSLLIFSCDKSTKNDTEAPTVSITYPANNFEFSQGTVITITADATDNKGIKEVRFYIDGNFVSLDESEPYEYEWDTGTTKITNHTIYAKAYDTSDNTTTSDIITVTLTEVIPPSKVTMTPHKCDPGDPGCTYTDRNNGIDAYSAGNLDYNWMKIQWDDTPLQKDGDIHHIDIWRFNEYGDTTYVEEIPFIPDSTTYYDKFIGVEDVIQRTWSYFIIPFDEAGNSTNSDTVSYRLIDVPGLQAPANNSTFSVNDSINFSWYGGSHTFRILFFDTSHNLIYSEDTNETSLNLSEIYFVPIPGFSYIWRIDAFFIIGQAVGSESEERLIHFTQ